MREAIYADLLAGERIALHRRIAGALERAGGPVNHGELARHWDAAGVHARALTASIRAGQAAAQTYAFRDALAHFERALELWPAAPGAHDQAPLDRAGLLAEAAEAARLLGDVERAMTLCREALAAVDPVAEAPRAACLHERLGRYCTWDPQRALGSYGTALELLGPTPSAQRARVLGNDGLALMYLDRLDDARRRCEEAVEVARAAAAPAEEASARSTLGVVLAFLGRPAEGEAQLRSALVIATRLGRAEDVGRAHIHLAEVLRYRGRIAEALQVCIDGERAARRLGIAGLFGGYLSLNVAEDLFHLGRWAEAGARLAAIDLDRLEPTGRQLWHSIAGRLEVARGNAPGGREQLETARALGEGLPGEQVPNIYAGLAELALRAGRAADARRLVAEGLSLVGDGGDALNTPILLAMGVRAHAADADREAAGALTARLERLLDVPEGRTVPPQGRAQLAECHAQLAELDGRPAGAHWRRAEQAWQALEHHHRATGARRRAT
jgi:tetratricopeptide (TPR) repeat protein